jgi:hypothetical protein
MSLSQRNVFYKESTNVFSFFFFFFLLDFLLSSLIAPGLKVEKIDPHMPHGALFEEKKEGEEHSVKPLAEKLQLKSGRKIFFSSPFHPFSVQQS